MHERHGVPVRARISGSGGLQSTDIAALNRSLRRNINSPRGYRPPIELTIARLDAQR